MSPLKLKVPSEIKKAETSYMVAFVAPRFEKAMQEAMEAEKEKIEEAMKAQHGRPQFPLL